MCRAMRYLLSISYCTLDCAVALGLELAFQVFSVDWDLAVHWFERESERERDGGVIASWPRPVVPVLMNTVAACYCWNCGNNRYNRHWIGIGHPSLSKPFFGSSWFDGTGIGLPNGHWIVIGHTSSSIPVLVQVAPMLMKIAN